jgi:hypothetical protein
MTVPDEKEIEKRFAHFAEDDTVFNVEKAKFEYTKDRVAMELDNERWKNRRRMAWLAMWAMVLATLAMFTVVPETKIEKLDEIVSWFMMAMASIVGTYIGTATWAQVSQARAVKPAGSSNPWDNYGNGRLDHPGANKDDYYREQ